MTKVEEKVAKISLPILILNSGCQNYHRKLGLEIVLTKLISAGCVSLAIEFVKISTGAMEIHANKAETVLDSFCTLESFILMPGNFITRQTLSKFFRQRKLEKMTVCEFQGIFKQLVDKQLGEMKHLDNFAESCRKCGVTTVFYKRPPSHSCFGILSEINILSIEYCFLN